MPLGDGDGDGDGGDCECRQGVVRGLQGCNALSVELTFLVALADAFLVARALQILAPEGPGRQRDPMEAKEHE